MYNGKMLPYPFLIKILDRERQVEKFYLVVQLQHRFMKHLFAKKKMMMNCPALMKDSVTSFFA